MKKSKSKQLGMLPEYDQNIYKGIVGCKTDELKENSMIKKSIGKALGITVEETLETGEKVNVTIADIIVAQTIKDAIKNPSTTKLKDLTAITGELKESVDVTVQTPQELFGDIIIKKKE